jgi:hypothetical protein
MKSYVTPRIHRYGALSVRIQTFSSYIRDLFTRGKLKITT